MDPKDALHHHVTGAIERGEASPIVGVETFADPFDGPVFPGDTIEHEHGPLRLVATVYRDEHHEIDDDDMHAEDPGHDVWEGADEGAYETAMEARKAYYRGEWWYAGLVLSVWDGDECLEDDAASTWGIEADYPGDAENANLSAVARALACEVIPRLRDIADSALDDAYERAYRLHCVLADLA